MQDYDGLELKTAAYVLMGLTFLIAGAALWFIRRK